MQIDIQDLLEKFRTGAISKEELALLEAWYQQWNPEMGAVSHEELEAIKYEVWLAVKPVKQTAVHRTLWPKIAAAASVLLFLSFFTYYFAIDKPAKHEAKPKLTQVIYDFKPGGNRAYLTLSNGEKIILTDAKNGKLAQQGMVTVSKAADGKVVYGGSAQRPATGKVIYNTMTTPRGGQYNLTLADGTKVWLNAASSITYPVIFGAGERRVLVDGEAYFEVAHDKNKPFKVSTGNQEIVVLGTHFNVKGYSDDAGISTTLLTGSIKIKNLISGEAKLIDPGQQAKIYKNNTAIDVKRVNTENAISWKNGYFLFDNQEIKSIMKIMSRWYDVDIEYNNTNVHDRFGGTFSRSSDLSETLHNLEQLGKIHFKIAAKKVIVTN